MNRRTLYGVSNVPTKDRVYIQSKFYDHINYRCRIALFGARKVGKTAIIQQFLCKRFPTEHQKNTAKLYVAEFHTSNGDSLTLEIVDTDSSTHSTLVKPHVISKIDAFILVYSVDKKNSWKLIENIRNQVLTSIYLV